MLQIGRVLLSVVLGWVQQLCRGSAGKKLLVALSSARAEYMAASLASCEAIWLRKMLFGLFGQALRPSVIYSDN